MTDNCFTFRFDTDESGSDEYVELDMSSKTGFQNLIESEFKKRRKVSR